MMISSWQDAINGAYELFAGFFILNHCRTLYEHKLVRGVSLISTVFFFTWGIWNMYYYSHLEQWASFYGGLIVSFANFLWIYLMIYYIRKEKGKLF